jgi:hypothetical protein
LYVFAVRKNNLGGLEYNFGIPLTDPITEQMGTDYTRAGRIEGITPLSIQGLIDLSVHEITRSGVKESLNIPVAKFSYVNVDYISDNFKVMKFPLEEYRSLMQSMNVYFDVMRDWLRGTEGYADIVIGPLGLAAISGNKVYRPSGIYKVKFGSRLSWEGAMKGFMTIPTVIHRTFALLVYVMLQNHAKLMTIDFVNARKEDVVTNFEQWLSMMLYAHWDDLQALKYDAAFADYMAIDIWGPLKFLKQMDKYLVQHRFSDFIIGMPPNDRREYLALVVVQLRFFQVLGSLIKNFFPENPVKYEVDLSGSLMNAFSDALKNAVKLGMKIDVPGSLQAISPPVGRTKGNNFAWAPVDKSGLIYTEVDARGPIVFDYNTKDLSDMITGPFPDPDIYSLQMQVGGDVIGPVPAIPDNFSYDELYIQYLRPAMDVIIKDRVNIARNEKEEIIISVPARVVRDKYKPKQFLWAYHSWIVPMLGSTRHSSGTRFLFTYIETDFILAQLGKSNRVKVAAEYPTGKKPNRIPDRAKAIYGVKTGTPPPPIDEIKTKNNEEGDPPPTQELMPDEQTDT